MKQVISLSKYPNAIFPKIGQLQHQKKTQKSGGE